MITVNSRTLSSAQSSRHKSTPKCLQHVLSISASVMRLHWRPPANETIVLSSVVDGEEDEDPAKDSLQDAANEIAISIGLHEVVSVCGCGGGRARS